MKYTTVTDPVAAGRELDDLAPVYEAVFAEPPYLEGPRDVAEFLERYQREHKTPGFRLVLARDAGKLAGFAYGLPSRPPPDGGPDSRTPTCPRSSPARTDTAPSA